MAPRPPVPAAIAPPTKLPTISPMKVPKVLNTARVRFTSGSRRLATKVRRGPTKGTPPIPFSLEILLTKGAAPGRRPFPFLAPLAKGTILFAAFIPLAAPFPFLAVPAMPFTISLTAPGILAAPLALAAAEAPLPPLRRLLAPFIKFLAQLRPPLTIPFTNLNTPRPTFPIPWTTIFVSLEIPFPTAPMASPTTRNANFVVFHAIAPREFRAPFRILIP